MKNINLKNIGKWIGKLICLALTLFFVYRIIMPLLPGLIHALNSGDEKVIAEYLENAGHWDGYLCVVLLQFIQVISIVLPGLPIHVASGLVFGVLKATLFCYLGYIGANMLVFLVARRVGNRMMENVTGKFENNWLMDKMETMRPGFVVALGCLMPGVPNGIIPYIAARSSITVKSFLFAVAVGSILPILTACLAGYFILTGDYVLSAISMGSMWVVVFILMKKRKELCDWVDRRFKK